MPHEWQATRRARLVRASQSRLSLRTWITSGALRSLASTTAEAAAADSHPGAFPFTAQARLNRQGWRARLANVERLLAEFWNNGDAADDLMGEDWAKVQQALAEIRAMIDGE